MKTISSVKRAFIVTVVCVATAVSLSTVSKAADPVKGGAKLVELSKVKTVGDIEALKPGDTFAMACAKCQTIMVKHVIENAKGAEVLVADGKPTKLLGKHLCTGCGSTIEVVGHGKGKVARISHTCGACGEGSAFCCATKAGSAPTKGMEEKK